MTEEFSRRPLSTMGIKNLESSSSESLSLQELERVINLLIGETPEKQKQLPFSSKSITDLFIEEKKNYFLRIHSNIMGTRNCFLESFNKIDLLIEQMMREIVFKTQLRKEELKAQLIEIRNNKMAKWDQQLSVCEAILQDLKRLESSPSIFTDASSLERVWNNEAIRGLGFVDSGDLKINTENYPIILGIIESLGTINHGTVSNKMSTLNLRCIAPKFTFGGSGADEGQFCRPWGVCSDVTGRILVCDRSNHRVQIFNESGIFLIQFGKEGLKPGEFNRPSGICVDENCRIIVADKDNHRIQIFTYSGHFLLSFGKQGTRPGHFMYPWDVAVNKTCDIAVSDSKNHRIQLFNNKGSFLMSFDAKKMRVDAPRAGLKFLDSPRGLAFRSDGSLFVTDFNNHRIILLNKKFNQVTTFGCEGHGPGQFFRPQGIACDESGRFAVADCKNYRVQIFDACGNFIQSFGTKGANVGEFDCPQGICFHTNKNIIVVDFNNNRVQVF